MRREELFGLRHCFVNHPLDLCAVRTKLRPRGPQQRLEEGEMLAATSSVTDSWVIKER